MGSGTSKNIQINAQVKTSLVGMDQMVRNLREGLESGTSKIDLTKGAGASLSRLMSSFEKDYAKAIKMIKTEVKDGVSLDSVDLSNSKDFIKTSQHVIDTFEELQGIINGFKDLTLFDAKKMFPDAFFNSVSTLKDSLSSMTDNFNKLFAAKVTKGNREEEIAELEKEISKLQETAGKETQFKISNDEAKKKLTEANAKIEEIRNKLKEEFKIKIDASDIDEEKKRAEIKKLQEKQKKRSSTKYIVDEKNKVTRYKGHSLAEWQKGPKGTSKQQQTAAIAILKQYEKEKQAIEGLEKELERLIARRKQLQDTYAEMDKADLPQAAVQLEKSTDEIDEVTNALKAQKEAAGEAAEAEQNLAKAQKAASQVDSKQSQIEKKRRAIRKLEADIQALEGKTSFSQITAEIEKLNKELDNTGKSDLKIDLSKYALDSQEGIEALCQALDKIDSKGLEELKQALKDLKIASKGANENVTLVGKGLNELGEDRQALTHAQRDMERLKDSFLDFFSLTNTVQIFKDALRDAFETVKELDAAMTETAVVTDFSIGDMWDKLPEYSEQATKLGASITDLYNATTLYYQQGLNSEQAMSVGVETMKMARIAGMEASDATTAMTAALRGFNMEINEISATRINDVYSELAAITAADTNQIATAMSKTASIASSANMEFETTAALLAQIIETTQEAPETAGTAMKTIIARFTEVKELFNEGLLTGEDEEGETIDINKIDAALKKVGISLKDFLRGEKGIDDIFLELASKWDSLDLATQRYIATTAAGSRQQSRFIAMMSNYDRTMELVTAANNSAGASQKQFDKTTESLAAKLQRLQNAWNTFTMGLANSNLIKGAVDLLTKLLETINKLTDVGDGKIGNFITTISRLGIVLGSLKAGSSIFHGFLRYLEKAGITKVLGLNMDDIGGIDLFGALFKTGKQANGEVSSLISMLKNPTLKGGNLVNLSGAFGKVSAGASGAASAVGSFIMAWGPWILLAAAIIAAIYGIAKAWQAASDSFKMEKLNDSINQMTSNIESAKQAIDDLKSSKNSLKVLQKEFSNLTKGTQEWKEKLIETNQQVLDLLDKYPELSGYITKTDSGSLDIRDDGWDALLTAQENTLKNTTNARIGMQYMRSDLQEKIDYEELLTSALGRNFGETIDVTSLGSSIGTALGTAIGGTSMGLLGSLAGPGGTAAGIVAGGTLGATTGQILGQQWGENNQKAIQGIFADIGEWGAQAMLDIAGFLDTGWGKVTAGILGRPATTGITLIDALNGEDTLEETVQRTLGAGYTEDEMSELLAALGDAGITFDDGSFSADRGTIEGILSELGFETSLEQVTALAQKLGSSFNELTLSAQEYALAKEGQRDSLMANALANSSVAQQDYVDSIGYLLGETTYENIKPMIDQKKSLLTSDEKKLKELYEQEVGGFYENGRLYSDSTMTTEWDLSKETMKSAIASAQVAKDMGVSVEAMATVISELSGEQQKIFTQLFSREGAAINSGHFDSYMTPEGIDLTKILEDMGFQGEDAFKQFVEKFGTEAGELLLDNFNMAADRITKARVDLAKKMRRSNKKGAGEFASEDEYIANELKRLEDKFGYDIRDTLNSVFATLNETGDQALVDAGYQKFMEVSETGSLRDLKDIENFISDVDWKNPIQAVKQLNHEVKYGSKTTSEYAKTLLEVGSSAFDGGAQMRYLLKSADFTDMSEDIEEIIEQQGELSAMDVLELVDSYEELNDVMENTGATAGGLAEILEQIAKGELSIDGVTDVVMAAMAGFESLDSYVAQVLKRISEFDWGDNENDVNEFVSEAWDDVIVPNIEAGRFNNSQLNKWMDLVAGSGWDAKLTDNQRKDSIVSYAQEWKKYTEAGNFSPFWDRVAKDQTLLGESKVVDTSAGSKYEGLDVKANADGSYTLVGYEGKDIEVIEEYLAEVSASTSEMASMALVDMRQQNANREMDEYFTKQDLDKGLAAALKEAETTRVFNHRKEAFDTGAESAVVSTSKKIVDQSEIDAIVAAYGEEYRDSIQKFFEDRAIITNFYDEEGALKSIEGIVAELDSAFTSKKGAEAGAKWIEGFATRTSDGKAIIDWNQVVQGLADANVPEQIRTQVGEAMLQGFDKEVETSVKVTLPDGTKETIEVTPNIDINTVIANAERDMELGYLQDTMTAAIQAAFGTEGLKVNFTEASAAELTAAIEAAVPDEIPTTVTYTPNTSALPNSFDPVYRSVIYQPDESQLEPGEGHARGIKNSPTSHLALVSEEGPELIQTEDGFYLTGQNGPELAYINKGDTVYTAKETEDILKKRKRSIMPRFSDGITGYGGGVSLTGGSGGRSSDDDDETWENSFDKLYNLVHKIDEELRQRERIERRYEKLLQSLDADANKIISVSRESLAQLEKERMLQEQLVVNRKQQINAYQSENSELMKYANVTQNDRGEDILRIDWEAINSVTDTEEGERIEEYVSQLEEWFGSLEEAEDALWEIEDAVEEIKERGKEEYFELEDLIKESVTEVYQEEIDELSKINDSINQVNADLVQAIQDSINKQRKDRDNQRTEDKLAEKQRRLAYLKQDTSGANDMEILRLEKELSEEQEDYTDTLIDQKISELQEQNDKAAKQREQQIKLAQAQLDHYIESGEIWEEVYKLMDEGLDKDSGLVRGSRLEQILRDSENFTGMSEIAKMEWMKDTNNMIAQALAYLEIGRQLEDIGVAAGTSIEFTTKDGRVLTGTVDAKGNVRASDGKTYNNVFQGYDGKYYAGENIEAVKEPVVESAKPVTGSGSSGGDNGGSSGSKGSDTGGKTTTPTTYKATKTVNYKRYKATATGVQQDGFGTVTGTGTSTESQAKADEAAMADALEKAKYLEQASYEAAGKEYSRKNASSVSYTASATYKTYKSTPGGVVVSGTSVATGTSVTSQDAAQAVAEKKAKKAEAASLAAAGQNYQNGKYYKTGGLADYTGPAWLDGTKSRPELVLNARDTQNFIQLKDILGSIMTRNFTASSTTTENNGDINYDIDINVETIGSDYDVEQVANKVKSMISENGRYRNNNAISLKR